MSVARAREIGSTVIQREAREAAAATTATAAVVIPAGADDRSGQPLQPAAAGSPRKARARAGKPAIGEVRFQAADDYDAATMPSPAAAAARNQQPPHNPGLTKGLTKGLVELRQQVAALQSAVDGRGSPQQSGAVAGMQPQPGGYYIGGPAGWGHHPPYLSFAFQPAPFYAGPPPQQYQPQQLQEQQYQLPQQQQQQQTGSSQQPPELASSDPDLAAAQQQHARHMALIKMEVDRERTAEELERIRVSLAELRGQQRQQEQRRRFHSQQEQPRETGEGTWLAREYEDVAGGQAADEQAADDAARRMSDETAPPSLSPAAAAPEGGGEGGTTEAAADEEPPDAWHQHSDATQQRAAAVAALDDERMVAPAGPAGGGAGGLDGARGSNADTDVLRVLVQGAGPFTKRGTYRCAWALLGDWMPAVFNNCQYFTRPTCGLNDQLTNPTQPNPTQDRGGAL